MAEGDTGRQGGPEAPGEAGGRDATGRDGERVSLLFAGGRLLARGRQLAAAVARLLAAEARLFKARVGLVFLAGIALLAFAVSLWACVVALIGWALWIATGSTGIALALLVASHVLLVTACWLAIKRGIHQASFPATRAQLAALRRGAPGRAGGSAAAGGDEPGA